MKVISRDNFDRDDDCEILIGGPGLSVEEATVLAAGLNHDDDDSWSGSRFYVVVADDYQLKVWEP